MRKVDAQRIRRKIVESLSLLSLDFEEECHCCLDPFSNDHADDTVLLFDETNGCVAYTHANCAKQFKNRDLVHPYTREKHFKFISFNMLDDVVKNFLEVAHENNIVKFKKVSNYPCIFLLTDNINHILFNRKYSQKVEEWMKALLIETCGSILLFLSLISIGASVTFPFLSLFAMFLLPISIVCRPLLENIFYGEESNYIGGLYLCSLLLVTYCVILAPAIPPNAIVLIGIAGNLFILSLFIPLLLAWSIMLIKDYIHFTNKLNNLDSSEYLNLDAVNIDTADNIKLLAEESLNSYRSRFTKKYSCLLNTMSCGLFSGSKSKASAELEEVLENCTNNVADEDKTKIAMKNYLSNPNNFGNALHTDILHVLNAKKMM